MPRSDKRGLFIAYEAGETCPEAVQLVTGHPPVEWPRGWYYWCSNLGECGPFDSYGDACQHAAAGLVVKGRPDAAAKVLCSAVASV